jgi:transposase
MNEITTVGVDLAKEVIVVCAADGAGRVVYFKQFSFHGFAAWAANLAPCSFGMEACSSAHYWARWLRAHGHSPRLMAAEFVRPFRKSQAAKNDRNDAQAIRIAMCQPDMRFVTVKSVEQQAMLAWHRMRSGYHQERTALINRTRGLLAEFGVWLGRSAAALLRALPRLAEEEELPARLRPLLRQAHEQLLVPRTPGSVMPTRATNRHSIDAAPADRPRGQTEHGENLANNPADFPAAD